MNKKKKSTNTSPYPDEVIDRLARAFYPAILACWNSEEGQRSLVGARPLHLANARPFGRSNTPQGCLLIMQTRTCRGAAPPSCYRKTVLSLESPTGAFIASLRFANANFIKSSPPGISDPTNPPNRRFPYKKTKKLIHPIMTALEDGFILKIPPIPDKTPHRGYNSFRPQ